ncbi:unnamed protein product [Prunus armeniaca]
MDSLRDKCGRETPWRQEKWLGSSSGDPVEGWWATHACTPGARQNATLKLSASVSSSRQRSHALLQLAASVAWSKY